jgi:hypothetical protein
MSNVVGPMQNYDVGIAGVHKDPPTRTTLSSLSRLLKMFLPTSIMMGCVRFQYVHGIFYAAQRLQQYCSLCGRLYVSSMGFAEVSPCVFLHARRDSIYDHPLEYGLRPPCLDCRPFLFLCLAPGRRYLRQDHICVKTIRLEPTSQNGLVGPSPPCSTKLPTIFSPNHRPRFESFLGC